MTRLCVCSCLDHRMPQSIKFRAASDSFVCQDNNYRTRNQKTEPAFDSSNSSCNSALIRNSLVFWPSILVQIAVCLSIAHISRWRQCFVYLRVQELHDSSLQTFVRSFLFQYFVFSLLRLLHSAFDWSLRYAFYVPSCFHLASHAMFVGTLH